MKPSPISMIPDKAVAFRADVSIESEVTEMVQRTMDKWGRIDLLCNNAGILDSYKPAHEVSIEEWNEVMAINATGPFLMSQACHPQHAVPG